MARGNGRTLSDPDRALVRRVLRRTCEEAAALHDNKLNALDLFGSAFRWRTISLMCCWVTSLVTYYALILNVRALSGDIFVNYCVASLADIPGFFFVYLVVDRFGEIQGDGVDC